MMIRDEQVLLRRMLDYSASQQQGAALVVAISAAVVVAITTGMVVNAAMRRFDSSTVQTGRMSALNISEAGTRYAWTRLDMETAPTPDPLAADARAQGDGNPYVIFAWVDADGDGNPDFNINNPSPISGDPIDELDTALLMGEEQIEVQVIWHDPGGANPLPGQQPGEDRYEVRAASSY